MSAPGPGSFVCLVLVQSQAQWHPRCSVIANNPEEEELVTDAFLSIIFDPVSFAFLSPVFKVPSHTCQPSHTARTKMFPGLVCTRDAVLRSSPLPVLAHLCP